MDIISFRLPVLGILSYRIPPQNWHMPPKSSFGRGICWFPGYFNLNVQVMVFFTHLGPPGWLSRSCRQQFPLVPVPLTPVMDGGFWYLKGLDIERKDALEKVCQIKMCAPCMIEEVMWNCWNCPDIIYIYVHTYLWYSWFPCTWHLGETSEGFTYSFCTADCHLHSFL